MPRRRNWDALSPAYRTRLERGGITKRQYEAGAKLSGARGHAETPEHPRDLQRRANREKYQKYKAKRERLVNRIHQAKVEAYDGQPEWDSESSRKNVNRDPETGKQRGTRELQKIADIIEEAEEAGSDLFGAVADASEYRSALYYH
jgi:hypothetical protein